MNPYNWWMKTFEIWMDLVFEVNALRNCHNQNKDEDKVGKIKKLLIKEEIWK